MNSDTAKLTTIDTPGIINFPIMSFKLGKIALIAKIAKKVSNNNNK